MPNIKHTDDRFDLTEGYDGMDVSYDEAVACVLREPRRRTSTPSLQRNLCIGYNRAALWLFWMEADGIVAPVDDDRKRDVLAWRQ